MLAALFDLARDAVDRLECLFRGHDWGYLGGDLKECARCLYGPVPVHRPEKT